MDSLLIGVANINITDAGALCGVFPNVLTKGELVKLSWGISLDTRHEKLVASQVVAGAFRLLKHGDHFRAEILGGQLAVFFDLIVGNIPDDGKQNKPACQRQQDQKRIFFHFPQTRPKGTQRLGEL